MKLSYALLGTAFIVVGAAVYIYLSSYSESDIALESLDEDEEDYF